MQQCVAVHAGSECDILMQGDCKVNKLDAGRLAQGLLTCRALPMQVAQVSICRRRSLHMVVYTWLSWQQQPTQVTHSPAGINTDAWTTNTQPSNKISSSNIRLSAFTACKFSQAHTTTNNPMETHTTPRLPRVQFSPKSSLTLLLQGTGL